MHKWYSMDEFKKLVGLNLINPKTDQKTSTQTLRKFAKENLAEGLHYKKLGNGRIVFAPEAVAVFFSRSLVKTQTKQKQEDNFKDYIFFASRVQEKLNEMYANGFIAKKVRWAYTRKLVADILREAAIKRMSIPFIDKSFYKVAGMISEKANALPPEEKKRRELARKKLGVIERSREAIKGQELLPAPKSNPYIKKRRLRK